jgi:polyisoprenoid-binding protein YceI
LATTETTSATTFRYLIDGKKSRFTIRAFAGGMLSAFGHNPTITVPELQGEARITSPSLEDATLRIVIQSASLVVTDDISAKDRQEIEHRMRDEVLESDGYPEIVYECSHVSPLQQMGGGLYVVSMNGELSLHGITRSLPVQARLTLKGDTLRAGGEFSIRQSDYEIRPVSAAGGTVKLKDEIKLSFDITALKQI